MVTGVGGASVGLEIFKALSLANRYNLIGADSNRLSYGLFLPGFSKTLLLPKAVDDRYLPELLSTCKKYGVRAIAPGSEAELGKISVNRDLFQDAGILLMMNARDVVQLCTNKSDLFKFLSAKNFKVPDTVLVTNPDRISDFHSYPCVVKPALDSGGSRFAFIAEDEEETKFLVDYLFNRGCATILQEYIAAEKSEFTVGVLSSPSGEILGSIALKRQLTSRLSYQVKYSTRVISSGISQGHIDSYRAICEHSERIAREIGSRWAINIQGRVNDGVFMPFEINPRHSGTTYLRALAGFNEPDILLQYCLHKRGFKKKIKPGYYLRSLAEIYVPKPKVKG
jgi:carbamoyl-phosphate synthase large subunit